MNSEPNDCSNISFEKLINFIQRKRHKFDHYKNQKLSIIESQSNCETEDFIAFQNQSGSDLHSDIKSSENLKNSECNFKENKDLANNEIDKIEVKIEKYILENPRDRQDQKDPKNINNYKNKYHD